MVIQKQIETLEQEKFVYDGNGNVAVRTTAVLETGDIEIGAVELKNSSTNDRVKIANPSSITTTDYSIASYDANVDAALTDVNTELDSQTTLLTDIETNTEVGNDTDLNLKMVQEQNPLWSRYTTPFEIVSEQDLTTSYADYGSLMNVQGYTHIGVIVAADVNTSEDAYLKVVGEMTATGSDEIEFSEGGEVALWTGTGSDFIRYYEFDISAMPFVQIQAKVDTLGTAGDLTISVIKMWRP